MQRPEDEQLIRRFQMGDRQAFTELADRYYGYVYRIFCLKGVPADLAEDFTQEIFVKLIRTLLKFKFNSTFKTYLDRTLRNRIIDFYRSRERRRKTLLYLEDLRESPDLPQTAIAVAAIDNKIFRRKLEQCLLGQSNLARRAVLVMWLNGLRLRQISTVLALPAGTVNAHLSRGKQALKACLEPLFLAPA